MEDVIMGCEYHYYPHEENPVRFLKDVDINESGLTEGKVVASLTGDRYSLVLAGEFDLMKAIKYFDEYFADILRNIIAIADMTIKSAKNDYHRADVDFTEAYRKYEIETLMEKSKTMSR